MDRDGWDLRYAAEERVFTAAPNPLVASLIEALPPGRGLDLAAGEGRHAIWLARRGWQVTAVDFSRVGVEKGRGFAAADGLDVDWVVGDVYEYEAAPASFDLVLVAQFHPEPPERRAPFFERFAGALAPGGHLVAVGRHRDDIGRDGGRGPRDPAMRWTVGELRDALPDSVEVLRCESVSRSTDDGVELTDVVALARRRG